jgi:hypothetical protein
MKTPQEVLEDLDVAIAQPLVLIMNFSLFQYLLTTFWKRRNERRVRMLLFVAALSFVALVPFGYPDKALARNLNDVSEVCSVLTFLLQITILTRDVGKRIKIRSLWVLLWIGELLVAMSLMVLLSNMIDIVAPVIDMEVVEELDHIAEYVSLAYIVGFRFYFLSIAKGYKKVWATQKTELFVYVLFLTHSIPFVVLHHLTGYSWVHMQALWMRMTIVMCLWRTVKARLTSQSSKAGATSVHGNGPRNSEFGGSQAVVHKPLSKVSLSKAVPKPKISSVVTASSTFRSMTTVVPQGSSFAGHPNASNGVEVFGS